MGSRSEKKQPGALVGEKSQTVFSANWKLDVMLLKNLQMLDVSKHRVSHRIAMDQRVVNKRFQTKLHRSKITHARMTNNKELLRELIHRDNYTFNTSVGGQDEKYTVKINPSESPQLQEEVASKEPLKYGNGKGIRPAATPVVVIEPNADEIQGVTAVYKPGSASEKASKRPSSSVSIAQKTITTRPATAVAKSSNRESQPTSQRDDRTSLRSETSGDHHEGSSPDRIKILTDRKKLRPQTAMPGLSKTTHASKHRERTKTKQDNHHLASASSNDLNISQTRLNPTSESSRPSSANSRPTSSTPKRRAQSSRQKHTMPSIFGEDKKPTLLDINRERLQRSNFPNRVKSFAGTLKGLQTDPDQTVDYYTLRLLENLQSAGRKGPRQFIESDAEKHDAQRSIGNLDALNMTFGDVKKYELNSSKTTQADGLMVKARLRAWASDDDNEDDHEGS